MHNKVLGHLSIAQQEELLRMARSAGLSSKTISAPPIEKIWCDGNRKDERLPLSSNQESLLFREWLANIASLPKPSFHVTATFSLKEDLNYSVFKEAVNEIGRRHDILRTAFFGVNTKIPVSRLPEVMDKILHPPAMHGENKERYTLFRQSILPAADIDLRVRDLQDLQEDHRAIEIERIWMDEIAKPFDYEVPPLMRCLLVKKSPIEHLLILVVKHLIADGWSVQIFEKELITLYSLLSGRSREVLPPLSIQYVDFAAWQCEYLKGPRLDNLISYWRRRWNDYRLFDVGQLPFSRPLPKNPTFDAAVESLVFNVDCYAALKAFAVQRGFSLYMLLLGAVCYLLHVRSGQVRIAVWGNFANRTRPETEEIIGWFANAHMLGVEVDPDRSVSELLCHVRETVLDASAHQELPTGLLWTSVIQALAGAPRPRRVFDEPNVRFEMIGESLSSSRPRGLNIEPVEAPWSKTSGIALSIVANVGNALMISIRYWTERFDQAAICSMLQDLQEVLQKIIINPSGRLRDLSTDVSR